MRSPFVTGSRTVPLATSLWPPTVPETVIGNAGFWDRRSARSSGWSTNGAGHPIRSVGAGGVERKRARPGRRGDRGERFRVDCHGEGERRPGQRAGVPERGYRQRCTRRRVVRRRHHARQHVAAHRAVEPRGSGLFCVNRDRGDARSSEKSGRASQGDIATAPPSEEDRDRKGEDRPSPFGPPPVIECGGNRSGRQPGLRIWECPRRRWCCRALERDRDDWSVRASYRRKAPNRVRATCPPPPT